MKLCHSVFIYALVLLGVAKASGEDFEGLVVFNDFNIFDNSRMGNTGNQQLVSNLVSFSSIGCRSSGTIVWFDRGRNSVCGSGAGTVGGCVDSSISTMRSVISAAGAGFVIENVTSNEEWYTDNSPGPNVKVIFLWNPRVPFTVGEIDVFQEFVAQGGRVVFVGEQAPYYTVDGVDTMNLFLNNMGSSVSHAGGQIYCYNAVTSNLAAESQITAGIQSITFACVGTLGVDGANSNDAPLIVAPNSAIVAASSSFQVAACESITCPAATYSDAFSIGDQESDFYRKSFGTNGGTNTFSVKSNCQYQITGSDVSRETYCSPQEWIFRSCELFNGVPDDGGGAMNGDDLLPSVEIVDTAVQLSGDGITPVGSVLSCTFLEDTQAENFMRFIDDVFTSSPMVIQTNHQKRCGSGPMCNLFESSLVAAYILLPQDSSSGNMEFCLDTDNFANVCVEDVCEWFEIVAAEMGCGEPIRRGTCSYTATPSRSVNIDKLTFKLSGGGMGGSYLWLCPNLDSANALKAFGDTVAKAGLFEVSPGETDLPCGTGFAAACWS